ncbi:MAG: aminoglycoside phosphotransferase family protein [Actinomycetota bacterium]
MEILKDDPTRPVVRIDKTVRRAVGWWTPAVHELLHALDAAGFAESPRVLGIDEQGREMLTYIEGDSGGAGFAMITSDEGLRQFAELLRAYHDCSRTLSFDGNTQWALDTQLSLAGEPICHSDFAPWNIVWRHGQPVGILDWDFALPGPAIHDIAYALDYAVPFRDDDTCVRSHGFEFPPDRRHRLSVFADGYGLSGTAGLVDAVIDRLRLDDHHVRALAERGLEPQATWVRTGRGNESTQRIPWIEDHRHLFT